MDRELKKKIKNIKKISSLIKKNFNIIKEIKSSELFLHQLDDVSAYINVEMIEKDGIEDLYIFGKKITLSRFINEGCILILQGEEFVVLKGI